jgi:hypothetical protein
MPRFFFHSEDGHRFQDKEGTVLLDLATAKRDGVKILGELMLHDPDLFLATERFRIIIQDDTGLTLYVVEMSGMASSAARGAASA